MRTQARANTAGQIYDRISAFSTGQVIGLWVLFALPVWSAAYKQAGCDTPEWFGISQVAEDAPGIGLIAKAAPAYDGPSFREVSPCLDSRFCTGTIFWHNLAARDSVSDGVIWCEQGVEYVFSFVWKPPILIAWKPRADLDRDAMDPARDTVVSSLYKVCSLAADGKSNVRKKLWRSF